MLNGGKNFLISPAEESSIFTGYKIDKKKAIISTKLVDYDRESDLALLTMVYKNQPESGTAQDFTGFGSGLVFDPNDPACKLLDTVYAFGCPAEFESSVTDSNF